ncbi:MAG: glycoside hydrolase family 27 protein [Acidobacteriaceae bacterium]
MKVYQRRYLQGLRFRSLIIAYCCLLLPFARQAAAQTDLTGYWVLHVDNGDGTVRDTFFQMNQDGETITGTLFGRGPHGTPITGTFKDGELKFKTVPPPPPAVARPGFIPRTILYQGAYQEGKLSLQTENFHHEILHGVAEKTTREAAQPPARLPLPALRDLPDNGLVRTPPMGWNSWNKFAGKVDDAAVRSMADAMVSSGMSKLGYLYINIDDTWEGSRDAAGNIIPNRKFPDMKALADYVHSRGLKIGIYSSPGPKTCAGYLGSFGHEVQDANTFASWGIDYIKYDLCSARDIYGSTQDDLQGLYQKMGEALENTHRPIVYSLCQYGQADVWKWGAKTSGNLWRTTGDIRDEWSSMDTIGFSQIAIASYAKPGQWNDPDMLEVGNGGMTTDEYRTHMSLWSMLAAPLIAGNDLRSMSDDTKSILMNTDVIAIDQDTAVKPVQILADQGKVEILERPLHDGSMAVGIFNRGDDAADGTVSWASLKLPGKNLVVRDLWRHEPVAVKGDSYRATIPPHGVVLLKVSTAHK